MNIVDMPLFQAVLQWLAHGLSGMSWWQIILYTLVTTHLTIISVTLYLHRSQAHRALDMSPWVTHPMRFWLWIGTGMNTKEWVSIHRKHHAKCETQDDPHSPQAHGIEKVFWQGSELYRAEAKNQETMDKYGHGMPKDWIERNVYTPYGWQGVGLMLIIDLALFGAAGAAVWAVQMAWIPVTAAGIINGIGHYWGYRNFEAPDASTNISPWGVVIGGEELHNNHHTYPTSAKFSVKKGEFDIGWLYIQILRRLKLATVKKVPPKMMLGEVKAADHQTLEALITHRYELMAHYARDLRAACKREIEVLKAKKADVSVMKTAKRWLHRDDDKVPADAREHLSAARAAHPVLDKMVTMRDELRSFWSNTHLSREQLAENLKAWCERAEASGIAALQQMSYRLRAARV
jgi:stearoyl-CoA desaturase (Delta-9 desaturase)